MFHLNKLFSEEQDKHRFLRRLVALQTDANFTVVIETLTKDLHRLDLELREAPPEDVLRLQGATQYLGKFLKAVDESQSLAAIIRENAEEETP